MALLWGLLALFAILVITLPNPLVIEVPKQNSAALTCSDSHLTAAVKNFESMEITAI